MYFTFFKQTGLFHASRENHHQTSSYNFSALGRGRQGCLATHDSLLPRVTLIPGGNAEQSSGPLGLQERRVPGVFLLLMQHVQDGETRASPTDSSDPSPPHPRPTPSTRFRFANCSAWAWQEEHRTLEADSPLVLQPLPLSTTLRPGRASFPGSPAKALPGACIRHHLQGWGGFAWRP